MRTILIMLTFLTQTNLFTFSQLTAFVTKDEPGIADVLIDKGYTMSNRSSGKSSSLIQFEHPKENYPSVIVNFKDTDYKTFDSIEFSSTCNDDSCNQIETLVKNNCKKVSTSYNEGKKRYVTKFVHEPSKTDLYVTSYYGITNKKNIVVLVTARGNTLDKSTNF